MAGRVLVVGIDGVGWNVIKTLMSDGIMMNFRKLIKEGVKATLMSTIPPLSGPAWFALSTGINPIRRGIIDLVYRRSPNSYEVVPLSSAEFRGRAIWDILGRKGWHVSIVNYPMLWPPYPVNGFMISGFGSPGPKGITYPPNLEDELNELVNGYEVSTSYLDDEQLMVDLKRILLKREKVIYYMAKEREWDFLFMVFSCTDWLQHYFWKHIDPEHPLHGKRSNRYAIFFKWVFKRIDTILGQLLHLIDENTTMLVLSDHGFQRLNGAFNLARWLELMGYIVYRNPWLLRGLRLFMQIPYASVIRTKVRRMAKTNSTNFSSFIEPDLRKSKSTVLEHSSPLGAIYLIERQNAFEKDKIIKRLGAFFTLYGLKARFYDVSALCEKEFRFRVPDIMFSLENWSYAIVNRPDSPILLTKKPWRLSPHSGTHEPRGIFVAKGPFLRSGADIGTIRAVDVVPTLLHLLNISIPVFMDGIVRKDVFEGESPPAKRPVFKALRMAYLRQKIRKLVRRARTKMKIS